MKHWICLKPMKVKKIISVTFLLFVTFFCVDSLNAESPRKRRCSSGCVKSKQLESSECRKKDLSCQVVCEDFHQAKISDCRKSCSEKISKCKERALKHYDLCEKTCASGKF